jgi:parallel beta-helix repeat protein
LPVQFTLPPNTRSVGSADPPNDMNGVVNCLNASGYQFNILNTAWSGGAYLDGTSNSTAAIQACMNAAAAAGLPVLIPGGVQFRVSQLTWNAGQVLQGVYSGTYPGNNSITTASVLARLASTNLDLISIPDGVNYGAIRDLAIDGNKNNNTSGRGVALLDGASGQESQIFIERCYIHDNPGSNLYLGFQRRANKVLSSVFNYSGTGDGITTCGSDNLIRNNIAGSNGRGGIVCGTGITQNWAAGSPSNPAAVEHIIDNDIYGNVVGIALASSTSDCMVMGNGIDRNTRQGITVYDGDSNVIECNSLHSNGTLTNNTYAHIDVGSAVTAVGIHGNNFGPLDAGVTNVASFCVNYGGSTGGIIAGNIGITDATTSVGGLINSASNTPSFVMASKAGAIIQGSGNDVADFRNSSGTLLTKITQGGSFVHSGGGAQFSSYVEPGNGSTAGGHLWSGSGVPNIAASVAGDFYFRTDTPSTANQRIYIATAANTWTALSV